MNEIKRTVEENRVVFTLKETKASRGSMKE